MEGVVSGGALVDPSKYPVPIETYAILQPLKLTANLPTAYTCVDSRPSMLSHCTPWFMLTLSGQQPRRTRQDRYLEGGSHHRLQALWPDTGHNS